MDYPIFFLCLINQKMGNFIFFFQLQKFSMFVSYIKKLFVGYLLLTAISLSYRQMFIVILFVLNFFNICKVILQYLRHFFKYFRILMLLERLKLVQESTPLNL